MAIYLVKRLILIILIVLCVVFVLFVLLGSLVGSRIGMMPIHGNGDALDAIFTFWGASSNVFTRFVRYCYDVIFNLDFGRAAMAGAQLNGELRYRTGVTLIIMACSGFATFIVGIPAGIYAAVKKDSPWDRGMNIVTMVLSSVPVYALALVVAIVFVLQLRLLPMSPITVTPSVFFMPTLTIMLGGISSVARMTRTSILEVLDQPYITALRAKGLKESSIIFRHALKNAMVPVISVMGGFVSQLLCGTFIVERFFNIRGLGSYLLGAVGVRGHYEILGSTVILTAILAMLTIAADVLYVAVNPQIRRRYVSPGKIRRGRK